jgi:hypothetical protein
MSSINFYFQNFIDEHEKNNQLDAAAITAYVAVTEVSFPNVRVACVRIL